MIIELLEADQETEQQIDEIEIDFVPQIGAIMSFGSRPGEILRYRVVSIEHDFVIRNVGEVPLEPVTSLVKTKCYLAPYDE